MSTLTRSLWTDFVYLYKLLATIQGIFIGETLQLFLLYLVLLVLPTYMELEHLISVLCYQTASSYTKLFLSSDTLLQCENTFYKKQFLALLSIPSFCGQQASIYVLSCIYVKYVIMLNSEFNWLIFTELTIVFR